MIRYCHIQSPLGTLTAVSEDGFLTELQLTAKEINGGVFSRDEALDLTAIWLQGYFQGRIPDVKIPLNPKGTPFQRSVWKLIRSVPYGITVTYGELAAQLGHPHMSPQAVGQAVGRNPIPILIPCHRVLGAGRKLTGYSGGLDKKRMLLDLEGITYS